MDHISLFNGMGGFQLAAQWMGWKNVMSCEIDPFCNQVTRYYWKDCKQYEDIRKTDFTIWRGRADVLSGGFPCQPFSNAGRKKGTEDNRYLWPEMLQAIEQIQPTWVVGENVTGILTMEDTSGKSKEVFPKMENRTVVRYQEIDIYEAIYARQKKMLVTSICEDLERIGYEVQPIAIPAASVGAPHRRERIWFLAHRNSERCNDRDNNRKKRHIQSDQNWNAKENKPEWNRREFGISEIRENRVITDTFSKNVQRDIPKRQREKKSRRCFSKDFVTDPSGIGQWRESYRTGETGFFDKEGKIPDWKNFPTQTPICDGNDGLSSQLDAITFSKWRRESIRSGGNAIVPQVALEFFKGIDQLETTSMK